MSGENRVKLSERIYKRAKVLWPRYLTHPFVTEMADGTLPKEKFRYYMVQDYLYLRDYVKIFAAILQKTDDFEQIRFLSGEMANTIDETFRTHLPRRRGKLRLPSPILCLGFRMERRRPLWQPSIKMGICKFFF